MKNKQQQHNNNKIRSSNKISDLLLHQPQPKKQL